MTSPIFAPEYVAEKTPAGLGFPTAWTIQVLKSPSQSQIINDFDGKPQFYIKTREYNQGREIKLVLYYINKQTRTLALALRLFPDLQHSFRQATPLELLESFANKYGCDFETSDGKVSRFVLSRSFPLVDGEGIKVIESSDHCLPSFFMRHTATEIQIALAVAIDLQAYHEWISVNG